MKSVWLADLNTSRSAVLRLMVKSIAKRRLGIGVYSALKASRISNAMFLSSELYCVLYIGLPTVIPALVLWSLDTVDCSRYCLICPLLSVIL